MDDWSKIKPKYTYCENFFLIIKSIKFDKSFINEDYFFSYEHVHILELSNLKVYISEISKVVSKFSSLFTYSLVYLVEVHATSHIPVPLNSHI